MIFYAEIGENQLVSIVMIMILTTFYTLPAYLIYVKMVESMFKKMLRKDYKKITAIKEADLNIHE